MYKPTGTWYNCTCTGPTPWGCLSWQQRGTLSVSVVIFPVGHLSDTRAARQRAAFAPPMWARGVLALSLLVHPAVALVHYGSRPQRVPHRRSSAVRADGGLSDVWSLLNQPPIVINRIEVFDTDKGVLLNPPAGVSLTESGYLLLFLTLLQQLFAPWGWVKYSKRLKEDEQAWLDEGKSPEQAVINAYQNRRPPNKAAAAQADEVLGQEDERQAAAGADGAEEAAGAEEDIADSDG